MIFVKLKYFLRTRHPAVFQRLVSMRYCGLGRECRALWRRREARRVIRSSAPYFAIRLYARCGLGALLSHTLDYLRYCELHNYLPVLEFHNPLYAAKEGDDWLPEFFTAQASSVPDRAALRFLAVDTFRDYARNELAGELSLPEAAAVFRRHLTIKREWHDEVDAFVAANFRGRVLGVHFRGTDKFLESGALSPEAFMQEVDRQLAEDPGIESVFVGTDEPAFLESFTKRFGHLQLSNYHLGPPLSSERPRHLSNFPGPLLAREALVTLLLFARCDVCVRTCSHLSGWSRVFNPDLKTVTLTLGKPETLGFPDRQIVAAEKRAVQRALQGA
jgi:hypothetical protein